MKNQHLWIVGMVLVACGNDVVWEVFGIILIVVWLILTVLEKK